MIQNRFHRWKLSILHNAKRSKMVKTRRTQAKRDKRQIFVWLIIIFRSTKQGNHFSSSIKICQLCISQFLPISRGKETKLTTQFSHKKNNVYCVNNILLTQTVCSLQIFFFPNRYIISIFALCLQSCRAAADKEEAMHMHEFSKSRYHFFCLSIGSECS